MNATRTSKLTRLAALMLIAGSAGASAQSAPTETRGVTAKPLAVIDLGPEIEGMAGRELRSRLVSVEAGGVFAIHNHRDRPGTVFVLQGRITEHRTGATRDFLPGQGWSEDRDTTHWLENNGSEPAVLLAVDIFKRP